MNYKITRDQGDFRECEVDVWDVLTIPIDVKEGFYCFKFYVEYESEEKEFTTDIVTVQDFETYEELSQEQILEDITHNYFNLVAYDVWEWVDILEGTPMDADEIADSLRD